MYVGRMDGDDSMDINISEYREWLKTNTSLAMSSINLYVRTVVEYSEKHDTISVQSINEFLSYKSRTRQNIYAKYAIRYLLQCLHGEQWRQIYDKVVKVKPKPRKKVACLLDPVTINKIINAIFPDKYKHIAVLQYYTFARARGIISLHENNIDLHYKPDVIRIRLIEKGKKEQNVYLDRRFESILQQYMAGTGSYLFIDIGKHADEEDQEKAISREYRYFWQALQLASKKIVMHGIGTHDLRRNGLNRIRQTTQDVYLAQRLAGHSGIQTTQEYFTEYNEEVERAMLSHQNVQSKEE